ncbi:hypothetical protein O181_056594 [Austropuccinia psidii MF-1]|uniref:Uncharacterized protein n=1 Tax=Austropuccinia psidii MF-1 TaxID=1389203 RepID=A0A9Q3HVT7_9BASI|nr:hypothetical protein [Austropuccinia psidii MF-1]
MYLFIFCLSGLVSLGEFHLFSSPLNEATEAGSLPQSLNNIACKGGKNSVGSIYKASPETHPFAELENTIPQGQGSISLVSSRRSTFQAPKDLRKHPRESSGDQQYDKRKKKSVHESVGLVDNYREIRLAWSSQTPTTELHQKTNEKTLMSPTFRNEPTPLEMSQSESFRSSQCHMSPKNLDLHENANSSPAQPKILSAKRNNHPPDVLSVIFSPWDCRYLTKRETNLFYAYIAILSKEERYSNVRGKFSSPLNQKISSPPKLLEEENANLRKNVVCLEDLGNNMMRIYFNVLHIISPKIKISDLRKEKKAIEEVFNEFFSSSEMTLAVLNADTRPNAPQSQKLTEFQKLVVDYLTFPKTKESWIVKSKFSNEGFSVSGSLRLGTEIALSFIKSYYQSTNWEKWKRLFENDQGFFKFMMNLAQIHKNNNQNKKSYPVMLELHECSTLIPWENLLTVDQESSLKQLKLLWPEKFLQKIWLESRVGLEFKQNVFQLSGPLKHEFQNRDFHLEQHGPKVYSFFYLIYFNTLLTGENKVIEQNVKESIDIFLAKYFKQIKILGVTIETVPLEEAKGFVEARAKPFLEVLWFMNQQFLEIFGCNSSDPAYVEAQQELQKWVWENKLIQNIRRNLGSEHTFQSENQNISPVQDKRNSHDQEIANRRPQNSNYFAFDQTKTVKDILKVLSDYYKTTNPPKFQALYDQDEDYLKLLLVYTQYWGLEASRRMELVRSFIPPEFKVLPWKDKTNAFEDIKQIKGSAELTLFKSCYSYQSTL